MRTRLHASPAGHDGSAASWDLMKALEANPNFRRDSALGGIFHLGKISYRDTSPTDSVHIVIDGDRVSAHVDEVSPLRLRPDGSSRYAWGQVLAHNVLALIGDSARRLRGLHGKQRCTLRCQIEWIEDDGAA
ncbi:MAG: hypothetical protein ABIW46_08335 [Acidimicrobiales bacterium]